MKALRAPHGTRCTRISAGAPPPRETSPARSPRHVGDVIEAAVLADLIGVDYGLMAWSATLTYDATVRAAPNSPLRFTAH